MPQVLDTIDLDELLQNHRGRFVAFNPVTGEYVAGGDDRDRVLEDAAKHSAIYSVIDRENRPYDVAFNF
mgnify:CR=1 FL=1